MEVIEKVAIAKKKKIKMNSRNWFDSEISEKLKTREKTLQKYKNMGFMQTKRYIKPWCKTSLQKKKKNLTECVSKSKDLKKAFKSVDLPNKSGGCIISAVAENQIVSHDSTFCL